ncbi:MAG: Twin-arginine translocation protein TatB [uncultured Nocardioidaceae bacterium]|uniref:Twin-arginine translocation protein TatB n=1 Tax=uncultured Nocardioidaceae bacterium TaxID=253824 RepID=A0A6J4N2H0_9ACTN|nr:MAG: Twin-arginine translocation protein TatB [uncultured Nocardioidaceae bacterium]
MDVGPAEFLLLLIVAIFVFGPDRLPDVARQAARLVRSARSTLSTARAQISDELGPELGNLDMRDLNPRTLVQKHLLDDLEDDDTDTPQRVGHRPLKSGESAPYDDEAT